MMRRLPDVHFAPVLRATYCASQSILVSAIYASSLIASTFVDNAHADNVTLEAAWVAAYRSNPTLASERAKLRATDEQVSLALSNWRPSVDAVSSVGHLDQSLPNQTFFGSNDFAGTPRGYGVQVKQPLFRGFRTTEEIAAAEKQVLAERALLDVTEQQLFLDTATAFLDLVRDIALVDATRKDETVLQKKLDEVQVRYSAGDLTQTDVHQAQSRLARSHVQRVQASNAIRLDAARYRRLTGLEVPAVPVEPKLSLEIPATLDEALDQAGAQNPAVISALRTVEKASAEVGLAKGALLPELDLVFNANRNWAQSSTIPGRNDTVEVQLQLNVPLYRAGADYSRTRAAVETAAQRDDDLAEARRKAQESAESAWQAMLSAQASFGAAQEELDSATLAVEGVREESRVGTRTTIDVLNAEQELLDSRRELVRSKHDQDLAILQLRAGVGRLTASALHLPTQLYDPQQHYDEVRNKWFGIRTKSSQEVVAHPEKKSP